MAQTIAPIVLTADEINACAAMVAIDDNRRDVGNNAPTSLPFKRSREEAIESLALEMGEHPNFIAASDAYKKSIGLDTVYTRYIKDGIKLGTAMKMRGEKIEMPIIKVRDGYHITRWNGSGAVVKDGNPEPVFGMPGPNGPEPRYHVVRQQWQDDAEQELRTCLLAGADPSDFLLKD